MKRNPLLVGAALAALMAAGCAASKSAGQRGVAAPAGADGECHGVNACKGQGDCGGKGHGCAGKNACKGQGWKRMNRAACDAAGGSFVPAE